MAEETIMENEENILSVSQLPPGFRFDPTDEELVLHFLYSHFNKPASFSSLPVSHYLNLIPVLEDFYHCNYYHPSQLNGKAFESYGKWYFYTRKTENRVTQNGYWKETDMDQSIFATCMPNNKPVGVKKCMVYYEGMFPSGVNTGWFIEEYHLCTNVFAPDLLHRNKRRTPHKDVKEWVLCRAQQICDDSEQLNEYLEQSKNYEGYLSSLDEVFVALTNEHEEINSPY